MLSGLGKYLQLHSNDLPPITSELRILESKISSNNTHPLALVELGATPAREEAGQDRESVGIRKGNKGLEQPAITLYRKTLKMLRKTMVWRNT